ncbi:S24/S26 family peptidase [Gordonia aurantiaca]|uniref:S24/S26 family peptidase n=1 Tax=Gordonia sp. B21 TaxID=3151852 RepID=UPI003263F7C4
MIFETGSMAPTIPTGSLGLSRTAPATSVRKGDVVSVVRDDGVRVTHRVESVSDPAGNSVSLRLRGDANDTTDRRNYVVTEVQRVVGTVPLLGYVAAWFKNPYTLALQTSAVVLLLGVAFAPKRGWRNSPGGQRILVGTAAATVVVMGVSSVQGAGEAHAATTATATGTVHAGVPNGPGWFGCADRTVLLLFNTVRLTWEASPVYTQYKLSFPDYPSLTPLYLDSSDDEDSDPNTFTYSIAQGLVTTLLSLLLNWTGSPFRIRLTNLVENFESTSYLDQAIRRTTALELPAGVRCVSAGTVEAPSGAVARRAAPKSLIPESPDSSEFSDPSESVSPESAKGSTPTAESTEADESSTPTPTRTELPADGKLSDSGNYAYYMSGGEVTIRSAENGEPEYEGRFSARSNIRWLPRTSTLEISEPDGTVTLVEKVGSEWRETVKSEPSPAAAGDRSAAASEGPVPAADESGPADTEPDNDEEGP